MTLTLEYLKRIAQDHGDVVALQQDNVPVSYTELAVAVNAIAAALQAKDPAPATRVALCAANSPEYLVSVLAIQAAGKILVPLDPQADQETLYTMLDATGPSIVLADAQGDARIRCDDEFKILFSQFEGLVLTYRDHAVI